MLTLTSKPVYPKIVLIYEGELGPVCGLVNTPMSNHLANLKQRDS